VDCGILPWSPSRFWICQRPDANRVTAKRHPLALFTFNVGVELGQLIFIAVILGLFAAARQFKPAPIVERHALFAMTYAIGAVAAFLFIERLVGSQPDREAGLTLPGVVLIGSTSRR